ncbi:MAG: cell wall-binding repeat-containing protein [Firmicutes bacterium]|nr:cell wall-binding repeat-containing protein [Bacillota bacterium]
MTRHKPYKKILMWALAVVFAVSAAMATAVPAFADVSEEDEYIMRLAGNNRFETSAIISLFMYDDDEADAIVIVNGLDYPDALAAAPFASSVGAPILMVDGKSGIFDPAVAEEIDRIDSNHNADIYIIGGERAVSEKVVTQLKTAGYKNISRIYGDNRFKTAVKIARSIDDKEIAFIANGMNYPDALGAGSAASLYGGAILFTGKDKLDTATKEYLEHIGFDSVVILGGTGAVSKAVEDELKTLQDEVIRIEGKDRYDTCLQLAEIFFETTDFVVTATGMGFADALAGGPFAAAIDAPILLLNPNSNTIDADIKNYIKSSGTEYVVVLGGTSAINNTIYKELEKLVK